MNLKGIEAANSLQSIKAQKPVFNLKPTKPLSNAEEKLIQEQFPSGINRKLELYMSTGMQKTEQPGAKGQHFDFRI